MSAILNLFYIYDPWLGHFLRMAFIAGIFALGALFYQYNRKSLKQGITIPVDSFVALLALIGVSVLPLLIHQTTEFGVILMYCKSLILFGFGVALYNLYYQQNGQETLIRDLKIGIIIQSVVGLLALIGIPFMVEALLNTNAMMPRFFGSEQEYRLYNITSSAFFQLSLFYIVLLHFLLAYNHKHNNIPSFYLFLMLFIGLISGRTFLFLAGFSILLYFKWRYIPSLVLFVICILLLAIYLPDNRYVAHALEPVINLISGAGKISSSTDNLVKNHLYLPQLKQILIGDGLYYTPDGKYYGASDSGFIRQALYGGVGYMLACFSFTAYFVYRIAQNWFNRSWNFILSTLFILSVCNVKADTYAFPGIMLVLLMFLSLFGSHGKNITLFKQGQN